MTGFGAPARTATPKPTRAMSTVGPDAKLARAAVSCITSTGTIPMSNRLPEVASLIKLGVVPKKISSLCPEACSNFGLSSPQTALMAPPARTLSSAACTFAIGKRTIAKPSVDATAVDQSLFIRYLPCDCGAPSLNLADDVEPGIVYSIVDMQKDRRERCRHRPSSQSNSAPEVRF